MPMAHHRHAHSQSDINTNDSAPHAIARGEAAMQFANKALTGLTYRLFHYYGLIVFCTTCGGFFGHWQHTYTDYSQFVAWVISLVGLVLAITAIGLSEVLNLAKPNCFNQPTTFRRNMFKGLFCIGVELAAMLLYAAAGIVFQLPPESARC